MRLEHPSRLLPLRRWEPEPRKRELMLSDGKIITMRTLRAERPLLFQVEGLLNASEAEMLIELAKDGLTKDRVSSGNKLAMRQSSSSFLLAGSSPIVDAVNVRAADLSRVPLSFWENQELLNVIRYKKGGRYDAHFDTQNLAEFAKDFASSGMLHPPGGPRLITLFVFLNDVPDGGETIFPIAGWSSEDQKALGDPLYRDRLARECKLTKKGKGVKVRPRAGLALLWYNHLVKEGELADIDSCSWHAGCEVKRGEKWIMQRWIPGPLPVAHIGRSAQPVI